MVTECGNFVFWWSFDKASLFGTAFRLVLALAKVLAILRFSWLSSALLGTQWQFNQINHGHFLIISSNSQSFHYLTGYFLIPVSDTTLISSVQIKWPDHFYQFHSSHQAAESTHSTVDMMLKTGYWQVLETLIRRTGTSREWEEVEGIGNIHYIHFTDHNKGLLI